MRLAVRHWITSRLWPELWRWVQIGFWLSLCAFCAGLAAQAVVYFVLLGWNFNA